MKILELSRSYYPSIGGLEKFISDRERIYKKLGYNYSIVTTTHTEKQIPNAKQLDDVLYLNSYTPYEIVPKLKKSLINTNFDVLSVNQIGYHFVWQAVNTARLLNKKIILTPHFYFHTKRYKWSKNLHFQYVVPKILMNIDWLICFTKFEANFWAKNFPFVERKIKIIPHYFLPPKIVGKQGLTKFGKYFLYLGRFEKNKRVDLLIKAFHQLETNYNLVLTIFESELPSNIKEIVDNDNRIYLLGRVPEKEKQNLLANCEALILPTEFEAFGIVTLEASFYRKPLLLTNLEVFFENLIEEGVIFFNNNLFEIKNAITKYIRLNEVEKKHMGLLNEENLKRFSYGKIVTKYQDFLINI